MPAFRSALRAALLVAALLPVGRATAADEFPHFLVPGEEQFEFLVAPDVVGEHARARARTERNGGDREQQAEIGEAALRRGLTSLHISSRRAAGPARRFSRP